jgi:RNA polymerase sigma-70 factor (ECF subfamily)
MGAAEGTVLESVETQDCCAGTTRLETGAAKNLELIATTERPLLLRVARRMAKDQEEAEDLVCQTILLAVRNWHLFDGRHPRSWLLRIMRNEFYRHKADEKRQIDLFFHLGPAIDDKTEKRISDRIEVQAIARALDDLPTENRQAVMLCDGEQMSYEDAANTLSVPMGTLRSRLFRGRRLLQQRLSDWHEA